MALLQPGNWTDIHNLGGNEYMKKENDYHDSNFTEVCF